MFQLHEYEIVPVYNILDLCWEWAQKSMQEDIHS